MSTRTKEEIENCLRMQQEYRDKAIKNIAALEAKFAALAPPPVELVASEANSKIWVCPKDQPSLTNAVCVIYESDCRAAGIDPAHLARFITTYPFLPRLMDVAFDDISKWEALNYYQIEECTDLARRYHVAMKGGAA